MKKIAMFILVLLLIPSISLISTQQVSAQATKPDTNNIIFMYGESSQKYLQQLSQTQGQVGTLSPSYFSLDQNGNLQASVDQQFVNSVHSKGYKVMPTLSNGFNYALGVKAMANRKALASQIAKSVLKHNLDGVTVDIEDLRSQQRDQLTQFLQLLANKLHPDGKKVTVTVGPATKATNQGWYGSYNYAAIGKIADTVYVMAYDYSYPGGPAGPVAPYNWVKRSVQYLTSKIPSKKLVLGIPFYGRYWTNQDKGKGISYQKAQKLISENNAKAHWNSQYKTMYAKFTDQTTGTPYQIWFANARSIMKRIDLESQYHLKGWGAWSLGWEDPSLWGKLAQSVQSTQKTLSEKVAAKAKNDVGNPVNNDHSAEFVSRVFKEEGVTLPLDAQSLSHYGVPVSKKNLKPGDIVLFGSGKSNIQDAGIYAGNGQFVIAYKAYGNIKTLKMSGSIAQKYYVEAVRVDQPIQKEFAGKIVKQAESNVGNPTTNAPSATFVSNVFGKEGLNLPKDIQSLSQQGKWISKGTALKPGDIVLFGSSKRNPEDAGIYIGNGKFVISYSADGKIKIKRLSDQYPSKYYLGAVRVTQERVAQIQRQNIVDRAKNHVGNPVKVKHSAAFVANIFDKEGINLPQDVQTMQTKGQWFTNQSKLQPGDIVFFGNGKNDIQDAGIYIGKNQFVIAYQAYGKVKIMNFSSATAQKYYVGASHVIQ